MMNIATKLRQYLNDETSKVNLINKYFPNQEKAFIIILLKLSKEQVEDICERYSKIIVGSDSKNYENLLCELFRYLDKEEHSLEGYLSIPIFSYNDVQKFQDHISTYYSNMEGDRLRQALIIAEQNNIISKRESKKITEMLKIMRGKKVSKENMLLYNAIDEAIEREALITPLQKRRKKSQIIDNLCAKDTRFKQYRNKPTVLRRNYDRYKKK